ncbi:hypothetical protein B1813_03065 [Saccharomonospora piscinae]|uniref:Uncharacterized protein n=1 Tax=Saccharomonospora piscinae TaxID=687388 RepID=A0A1V9AD90_SACPI|nr:hypothetical protein [Saccharomonospora piscinae]OQO95051.1 hypothetical protein B1813_03065 [Saccharomonospora piscinae]
MSLEIADHWASLVSALVGVVGIVLTAVGLRRQRSAVPPPPEPPPVTGLADTADTGDRPRLYIPERHEFVPGPEHLPGGPQPQGWMGTGPPRASRDGGGLLSWGAALVVLSVVAIVVLALV